MTESSPEPFKVSEAAKRLNELAYIGELAPEGITEADLDAQVPPADPLRTILRQAIAEALNVDRYVTDVQALWDLDALDVGNFEHLHALQAGLINLIQDALDVHHMNKGL